MIDHSQAVEAAKQFLYYIGGAEGIPTTDPAVGSLRDDAIYFAKALLSAPPSHEQPAPGGEAWCWEFVRDFLRDVRRMDNDHPMDCGDDYDTEKFFGDEEAWAKWKDRKARELAAQCRAGEEPVTVDAEAFVTEVYEEGKQDGYHERRNDKVFIQNKAAELLRMIAARTTSVSDHARGAAERLRTKWDRSSKTMDAKGDLHFDYIRDLAIIADEWMKDHPE